MVEISGDILDRILLGANMSVKIESKKKGTLLQKLDRICKNKEFFVP